MYVVRSIPGQTGVARGLNAGHKAVPPRGARTTSSEARKVAVKRLGRRLHFYPVPVST